MRILISLVLLTLLAGPGCKGSRHGHSGPAADECAPRQIKTEVLAIARQHYLWPELLPAGANPDAQQSPEQLLEALTAEARAQGKDRDWSHLTSKADFEDFCAGRTSGYGLVLGCTLHGIFIIEVMPGSSAAAAGLERGQRVLAVATSLPGLEEPGLELTSLYLKLVVVLQAPAEGAEAYLRVQRPGGAPRDVKVTNHPYLLDPVPGAEAPRILEAGHGHRVGYLRLVTFIETAQERLRLAMKHFRQAQVTDLVIDLRGNGGGDMAVADTLAGLLRRSHSPTEVLYRVLHNRQNRGTDELVRFASEAEAMDPGRLAFIVSDRSASASETLPNALAPYYGHRLALVGARTYGKPVGQEFYGNNTCDWMLGLVTVEFRNSQDGGGFFAGLPYPGFPGLSIPAKDDLEHPLGDPAEASLAAALAWISTGAEPAGGAEVARSHGHDQDSDHDHDHDLSPAHPRELQRLIPGLF